MNYLRKEEIQKIRPVDKVEYLTDKMNSLGPYEPWQNAVVHYTGDKEHHNLTAWVWHARYSGSIVDDDGHVTHLYADRHGLFGIDYRGLLLLTMELSEPYIHDVGPRNPIFRKEEQ